MAAIFCLATIPSANEALCDPGMFDFVALHLLSAGGCHSSTVNKLLCLIERLEGLHTKVQGVISSPHLATIFFCNVSRQWSQYLNRCVSASASEVVEAPGGSVSFSLKPSMVELEIGRCIALILPISLADIVAGRRSAGEVPPEAAVVEAKEAVASILKKSRGSAARLWACYEAYLTYLSLRDGYKLRSILAGVVLPTLHSHIIFKN